MLAFVMLVGLAASLSRADTVQPDPVVKLLNSDIVIPVPSMPPSNAGPMNPASPGDVVTQRYNNLRTGTTLNGGLDQSMVSSENFGLVGILGAKRLDDTQDPNHIDGVVLAQPLFMANVDFREKGRHSAIFIATSTNWVYAFDADTLQKLWEHHLGDPFTIERPFDKPIDPNNPNDPNLLRTRMVCQMSGTQGHDLESVELGIEATPVIDVARQHIIVSYRMMDGIPGVPGPDGLPSSGAQRIAALELATGNVVKVDNGTPNGMLLDRRITDDPLWNQLHRSRASLLLDDDKVYVGFAGRCETNDPPIFRKSYQGWVFAFNAGTLAPLGAYRAVQRTDGVPSPNPADDPVAGGGIWQASTGLAADGHGSVYFTTGNQTRCAVPNDPIVDTKCSPPGPLGKNLSDSVVRLRVDPNPGGPPGSISMTAADWFTPYRKTWLDSIDLDFAAAGLVLIPNTRYLVAGGKEGMLYVLDRDNLGKFDDSVFFDASTLAGSFLHLPPFHTSEEPGSLNDPGRDQVVQKFRAGENQYCAASAADAGGPKALFCLNPGDDYPSPTTRPPGVTMNGWIAFPHIHGTPLFGAFRDGRAFLYVWPEKDFLKSFQWWGRRFDTTPTKIAINKAGARVLAPPYLQDNKTPIGAGSAGMPGGILALSIDFTQPAAGVLFASVQRCRHFGGPEDSTFQECTVELCQTSDTQSSNCGQQRFGMLRAFDPITLQELWNNQIDKHAAPEDKEYWFAKFVPPTIANGRVYLPTASRRVLVYGMH